MTSVFIVTLALAAFPLAEPVLPFPNASDDHRPRSFSIIPVVIHILLSSLRILLLEDDLSLLLANDLDLRPAFSLRRASMPRSTPLKASLFAPVMPPVLSRRALAVAALRGRAKAGLLSRRRCSIRGRMMGVLIRVFVGEEVSIVGEVCLLLGSFRVVVLDIVGG